MSESKRILVVGPAWVGDMVMAQSLFITLKQLNPRNSIDVVAPSWSKPLLARMPQVNEAIELSAGHKQLALLQRYRLGKNLRRKAYDQAIVLPRSFKSALIPFFARAPIRTGYRGEMRYGLINDMRPLNKLLLTQTVQRQVALGHGKQARLPPNIPKPSLIVNEQNQHRLVNELGLSQDRPVIGMMPGAEYGPSKQWPVAAYAQLAAKLVEAGAQVWVFGSAKESALGDDIKGASSHIYNLCGRTQLADAIDLIALCRTVVTNDSGLMHVACATGRKVIAIYGSSNPAYTPPLSDSAVIHYKRLECSPCFKRVCPLGHTHCMTTISVDEVLASIDN